jgi:hypothetical protein
MTCAGPEHSGPKKSGKFQQSIISWRRSSPWTITIRRVEVWKNDDIVEVEGHDRGAKKLTAEEKTSGGRVKVYMHGCFKERDQEGKSLFFLVIRTKPELRIQIDPWDSRRGVPRERGREEEERKERERERERKRGQNR